MEVIQVRPSGYCKGVINAINKVKQAIIDYPDQQIYILGMLIHNKYVVQSFSMHKVITLEDKEKTKLELLEEIDEGIVVFTAHGIDPKIKQYALDKGLTVIDATCGDVIKNSQLCQKYISQGYDIIYIGKHAHPESEAVTCLSDQIHLVTNEKDIANLSISNDKILVTNQTTMSILDIRHLIEAIQSKYPGALLAEEICNATKTRQNAIRNLEGFDTLVVVGDPASNNTAQLANIAKASEIKNVIKVETASQLADYDLSSCQKVAVTSGASTPAYLTNQVIGYLKTLDPSYFEIQLNRIIDM